MCDFWIRKVSLVIRICRTITQEDVDYLLDVINHRYPEANITLADIEASWAGLRPLLIGNSGSDYNGRYRQFFRIYD